MSNFEPKLESKTKRPKESKTIVIMVILNADVVLLLELEVLLPQGVDGVNHDLDQLDLGVSETVFVGDVISVACEWV